VCFHSSHQVSNFILTPRASRSGHFGDDDDDADGTDGGKSGADKEQENVPQPTAATISARRPSHTRSHSDMLVAASLGATNTDKTTPIHHLTRAKSHSPGASKGGIGSGLGVGAAGLLHSPYAKIRSQASHSLEVPQFSITFGETTHQSAGGFRVLAHPFYLS
jgi:hypothetical protein